MLEEFIEANGLKAELIKCRPLAGSARSISDFLKIPLDGVIRTILFIDERNEPLLAILLASDEVDKEKLCRILKTDSVRAAKPEEAPEITGYEAGSIPPISVYGVKTVMDKKVREKKLVASGGGDNNHVLKISPEEIEENAEGIIVADIVK